MNSLTQLQLFSLQDVISLTKALVPAQHSNGLSASGQACTTPLIEGLVVNGVPVALRSSLDPSGRERHGAVYVRVSTLAQQVAGFSIDDQVRNGIKYFLDKGHSFRVYSDAGLSGSLPYRDEHLMRKMVEAKVKRYRSVFRRVFLSRLRLQSYTPEQEASVREYLERRLEHIRRANPISELDLKPKLRQKLSYRPGLTALVADLPNVHTVVVNDLTRLSRNQYLFAEVVDSLGRHGTKVVGVMESLDYLNVDEDAEDVNEFGAELQAWFLAKMAEHKLREATLGTLRGLLEMLEQGKPHGKIPSWLRRVEPPSPDAGKVVLKSEAAAQAVLRLIEIFVDERCGPYQTAKRLTAEGVACPSRLGRWTYDNIRSILLDRALVGYEREFGLEFPMYPALIDEARWQQIQTRWAGLDRTPGTWGGGYRHDPEHRTKYLATGLIKCVCAGSERKGRGGALVMRPSADPEKQLYMCGCAPRKPGVRHSNLRQPNVDTFINGLMASDPAVFLGQYRKSSEYQELQEELLAAERAVAEAEASVAQRRAELEPAAHAQVEQLGLTRSNPKYGELVSGLVTAWLAEDQATRQLHRAAEQREAAARALAAFEPPERAASLAERISRWEELEVWEKNAVLRSVFDRWYVRELGSPLKLELIMVLRNGEELPPVPIRVIDKKRSLWRRLPDAGEWIQSVIAAHGSKRTQQMQQA